MISMIPFTVDNFAAGLTSGTIERFGAILKDTATGKIVGHVQETGLIQQAFNGFVGSPIGFTDPVSSLASLGANAQLLQVKGMIEGLQLLGIANLAATVTGIGVSVTGFALMNRRFNQVQKQIDDLDTRVMEKFRDLHLAEYRSHFSVLRGMMDHADQLHYTNAATENWQRLAGELARESAFFKGEIDYILQNDAFDEMLFTSLAAAYAVANGARVQLLVNSKDLQAARRVAEDLAMASQDLFDVVTPTDLSHKVLLTHFDQDELTTHLIRNVQMEMEQLVQVIREAQDVTLTRPLLIDTLIEQKVDGREYMKMLREEDDHPFLILPANQDGS